MLLKTVNNVYGVSECMNVMKQHDMSIAAFLFLTHKATLGLLVCFVFVLCNLFSIAVARNITVIEKVGVVVEVTAVLLMT